MTQILAECSGVLGQEGAGCPQSPRQVLQSETGVGRTAPCPLLVAVESSGQQGNKSQSFGWEGVQLSGGAGRHLAFLFSFYLQGNLFDFLRLTGWRGSKVLYFGDHLYSDLAVSKKLRVLLLREPQQGFK